MLEAARLPTDPRGDAFLDVVRQLLKVMPKLHDRSGYHVPVAAVAGVLSHEALNQLSDEFRALPMVLRTVGLLLHPYPPSLSGAFARANAHKFSVLLGEFCTVHFRLSSRDEEKADEVHL